MNEVTALDGLQRPSSPALALHTKGNWGPERGSKLLRQYEEWMVMEDWKMAPKGYSHPNIQNLWMMPYNGGVFAAVIKLRTLRWDDYSVLSGWILHAIDHMYLCKRKAERDMTTHRGEGDVKTSRQRSEDANLKTGVMQPDVIGSWKEQEQILP